MQIAGLQKTTLVDFPGKIAATVFTRGCTFACPFCHNPELVVPEKFIPLMDENEIMAFFEKRKHQLKGVCITGGEPTIHKDIHSFVHKLKEMGYAIKLDTNGSNPETLETLIKSGELDYIAMDIKSPLQKYEAVTNSKHEIRNSKQILNSNDKKLEQINKFENYNFDITSDFDIRISNLQTRIMRSIELVMSSGVDYEFRTTVCHPLHEVKDFEAIGQLIKGSPRYFIQNFVQSKHINEHQKFLPFTDNELGEAQKIIEKYIKEVTIR